MIEKIKKNKFLIYLLILIIGLVLVLIIRTAYAYLMADIGLGKIVNINSNSDTLDKLDFIPGTPLSIAVTPTTLKENGTNITSISKPKVSLLANSTNNTATYNYYVYFKMTSDFVYTVNDTTPELMLTITDGTGTQITNIAGLVYKTFGGVSGFDITNKNGTFPVSTTSSITSTSATTATIQEWTFTLTYLNLNTDQAANIGKIVTTEIKFKKDVIPTIASACVGQNMASCIKTNYELDNNLNLHDMALTNGANDGSYRFSGANPNNYVCFGPGATAAGVACPEENQYRIIGVFGDQVKLIKKTSLGNKVWNTTKVNTWGGSTMDNYLNGEYLTSLTPIWSNKIANNTWQVGGMMGTYGFLSVPLTAINYEVGANKANVISNSKIGLMYVSDYGFAASPSNWTLTLNIYNNTNPVANIWLFVGNIHEYQEWTISRYSNHNLGAYVIALEGNVNAIKIYSDALTRPSFYLQASINLVGGNGTAIDPYRIN